MSANPYMAYRKQSVESVSQKQLIIMLYEGMIRFMKRASMALDAKKFEEVHINLTKANNIIIELLSGINEKDGGEIAHNLKRLYVYSYEQLTLANIKKEKDKIEEVIKIMSNLLEAWQAVKSNGATINVKQEEPRGTATPGSAFRNIV